MKNLFTFALLIISSFWSFSFAQNQMDLPVTFDDATVNYSTIDFGGTMSSFVADPTNPSNMVVQTIKTTGAEFWAGTTLAVPGPGGPNVDTGFVNPIPFAAGSTFMSVRVWSTAPGLPVRLKVEKENNNTITCETEAVTTASMAWETLTFDFSNEVPGTATLNFANTYDMASLFYNFGTAGAGEIFYWDDIMFAAAPPPVAGNIDFAVDMRGYSGALNFITQGVYLNGSFNGWCGVCNPMTDLDGDSIYTTTLLLPAGLQEFKYTIDGWSDQETLTLGDPCVLTTGSFTNRKIMVAGDASLNTVCWNSCISCSIVAPPSGNPQFCDSLVYHFMNPAEILSPIRLTISNTGPNTMDLVIESADADPVDLLVITNGTGASISAESYPSPGKIKRTLTWISPTPDIDLNVIWSKASFAGNWQLTATDITVSFADTCAGYFVPPPPMDGNIDFAVDMRGYTGALNFITDSVFVNGVFNGWCGSCNPLSDPDGDSVYTATILMPAGTQEFKYTIGGWNDQEALTPGDPCVLTTGINTNRVIEVNGDATLSTICWNSCLACAGGSSGLAQMDLPVTFEDESTVNYVMEDFGGNASTLVVDPTNPSNMVVETIKDATAETWAGTSLDEVPGAVHVGFVNAIPFTTTSTRMSVRVWSPVANIPVRLKAENSSNNTITVETEAMITTANTWETLVFDFSSEASGTAALNLANTFDMVSIFFDFGTDGATVGAARTYYWDDVQFGVVPIGIQSVNIGTINAYPNPTEDFFILDLKNVTLSEDIAVSIVSKDGKLIRTESFKNLNKELSLDLSNLESGVYFIELTSNGQTWVNKVMKK